MLKNLLNFFEKSSNYVLKNQYLSEDCESMKLLVKDQ